MVISSEFLRLPIWGVTSRNCGFHTPGLLRSPWGWKDIRYSPILSNQRFFRGRLVGSQRVFASLQGCFLSSSFHSCSCRKLFSFLSACSRLNFTCSSGIIRSPHRTQKADSPSKAWPNLQVLDIFFSPSLQYIVCGLSIYRLLFVSRSAGVRQKSIALYSYGTYIISVGRWK